jgi:hypothetical protein
MSHLLTRLADRAMGIAPTIEPVRSPMFGGEPAVYGETAERETTGFFYGDIVTGAQAGQAATTETSAGFSNAVTNQVEQDRTQDSFIQPVSSRVLHEPSAAAEDNLSTRDSNDQQQGHDSIDLSPLVASPPRLIETVAAVPEPSTSVLSPVSSQAPRSVDSHPSLDERVPKAVDTFIEPPASSDSPAPTTAETQLRPRAFLEPILSAKDAIDKFPQESSNARSGQPTIKVTIGRIEVRAVTPPPVPAPRQRKKTQASLSLDDYLKQRAGGRR